MTDSNRDMATVHPQRLAVCIAEDRKSCEPALRVLLTSLCRHSSEIAVTVFYSDADQTFLDWAHDLAPDCIEVRTTRLPGTYGWNVKPQALLQLLREGNPEVVWIDSDVVVTKNICDTFSDLNEDTVVVTEEALWGAPDDSNALRARLWGFPINRSFPFTLNTAVVRVTQAHVRLLERWKELLECPEYRRAQEQQYELRQPHMVGDQDVFTALLCCEEFHQVPVNILHRGTDIIQYFGLYGYTLAERISCIAGGMPVFIHSQGVKPWRLTEAKPTSFRRWIDAIYLDLSPYTLAASKVTCRSTQSWTDPRSILGSMLRKLGLGYAPLVGLPLAAAFDLARGMKFIIRRVGSWRGRRLATQVAEQRLA